MEAYSKIEIIESEWERNNALLPGLWDSDNNNSVIFSINSFIIHIIDHFYM